MKAEEIKKYNGVSKFYALYTIGASLRYATGKEHFETVENELRAFGIIAKKKVNIGILYQSLTLELYNRNALVEKENELTQEEYNYIIHAIELERNWKVKE